MHSSFKGSCSKKKLSEKCMKLNYSTTLGVNEQNDICYLKPWLLQWAASSRKTATRENQDSWLVCKLSTKFPATEENWGGWDTNISYENKETDNPNNNFVTNSNELKATQNLNPSDPSLQTKQKICLAPKASQFFTQQGDSSGHSTNNFATDKLSSYNLFYTTTLLQPWVFGVFDGHGPGGRIASTLMSQTLPETLKQRFTKEPFELDVDSECDVIRQVLLRMKNHVEYSFQIAQKKLIEKNEQSGRDFGTTAIVVSCLGRYILTATCGDSSAAIIVAAPPQAGLAGTVINVQTHVDHSLENKTEISRIEQENKGKIVLGDGGIYRLIPSLYNYKQAKMKGLSINMARAMGHQILSQYGLCSEPQFTLLDIADILQILTNQRYDVDIITDNRWQSLLLEARLFEVIFNKKFPCTKRSNTERTFTQTSRTTTRDTEDDDSSITHMEAKTQFFTEESTSFANLNKISSEQKTFKHCSSIFGKKKQSARTSSLTEYCNNNLTFEKLWCLKSNTKDGGSSTKKKKNEAKNLIKQSCIFLVLMSDGVSDVLTRQELGEFLLKLNMMSYTPEEIANAITQRAERTRHQSGCRPDNCTAVVVKFKTAQL